MRHNKDQHPSIKLDRIKVTRVYDVQIDYRFPTISVQGWSIRDNQAEIFEAGRVLKDEYFAQGEEAAEMLEIIESMDGATLATIARLLGRDDVTDADLVVYLLGL